MSYLSLLNSIMYSCVSQASRSTEQFVPVHSFGHVFAGELHISHGRQKTVFKAGDTWLIGRNQLARSVKVPPPDGEFRSISIHLEQEMLRAYCMKHNLAPLPHGNNGEKVFLLPPDPFIKGYFNSLLPYFSEKHTSDDALTEVKATEALLLLQKVCPQHNEWLFDFSEPGKIDLEAFMQQHYMYNVSMSHFARLTGRSLASFKRDFEKIFHSPPSRWLLEKRLTEAHFLIKEKGRKPSDVYLDLGFEDLSHFSFAFKKKFGYNASALY